MQCGNPVFLSGKNITVPCGKCRGCRIRRSSEWTMRLTHQLQVDGFRGAFVTLTYDDESMPRVPGVFPADVGCKDFWTKDSRVGTLSKEDLRNYFKRLRYYLPDRKIKYYACGEYGEPSRKLSNGLETVGNRPHYHIILFGVDMFDSDDSEDRFCLLHAWPKCEWNELRIKEAVGSVTPDSMRYTTDYIHKKLCTIKSSEKYLHYGNREPEFQVQSIGLGKEWLNQVKSDVEKTGKICYKGKEFSLPRYYLKNVDVDIDVRLKNKDEKIKDLCEEYGYDEVSARIVRPFDGHFIDRRYKDNVKQYEKNLNGHASLFSRQKL